jgi:quercetin dioxygenase-like cupin family protein
MEKKTIDLKQVLGLVAEYDNDQNLISPDKPFELKATFFPGAASNIHKHPFQEEYYKIHHGEIELFQEGKWRPLKTGEEAFIPMNKVHGFRNNSSDPAYLTNIHKPGLNFGASLVAMESLVKAGKINGTKGFKNLIYLSQHSLRFGETIESVRPSKFLMKGMAKLGVLMGYKI